MDKTVNEALNLSSIYLKPKKDPHVRIGESFQAYLPLSIISTQNENSEPLHPSLITFKESKKPEEIKIIKDEFDSCKPSKKRRLDF